MLSTMPLRHFIPSVAPSTLQPAKFAVGIRFGEGGDQFTPSQGDLGTQREAIRADVRARWGMVPNVVESLLTAPATARLYLQGRELMGQASLTAVEQDVVQMVASQENSCHYCVPAHGASLAMGGFPHLQQLAVQGEIPEARLQALVEATRDLMATRGALSAAQRKAYNDKGVTDQQLVEIIGLVALKTISNFTNRLLKTSLEPWMQS